MASREADNVSMSERPLSANPSKIRLCWRARAPMIASAYSYSAQQGHGEAHQTCLAHLAHDVARGRRCRGRAGAQAVAWFGLRPGQGHHHARSIHHRGQAAGAGAQAGRSPGESDRLRPHPRRTGQDAPRPQSAPDLRAVSGLSRTDQQCLRARPQARRHPAQEHQWLPRHVVRRRQGRRPNGYDAYDPA